MRYKRTKMLRVLSHKKKKAFYQEQIGTTREVLVEAEEESGTMNGFTENYVKVKIPFDESLINTIQTVSLSEIDRDGLMKVELLKESIHA